MITRNKVLLVLDDESVAEKIKFQAIVFIEDEAEIKLAWERNKTPIIAEAKMTSKMKTYESVLHVSEYVDAKSFVEFCHSHLFECGEFMSKAKYDTSKEECFLCDIGSYGGYESAQMHNRLTKKVNDLIIYDSENFFVKIELGCLNVGMLMICPKEHIMSAAQIPSNQVEEYNNIKRDVEIILKKSFGDKPVLFFENGSAPDGLASYQRSIVHAHTHVAWNAEFEQKYIDMVSLKPTDISVLTDKKYLSYQVGADGEFLAVYDPEIFVQRQYARQVVGEMLGIPNEKTNWRVEPFMDKIIETYTGIHRCLTNEAESFSDRILEATYAFTSELPNRPEVHI